MELATQMESKGIWIDLFWTPREQNTAADSLSNGQTEGFSPALCIASSFSDVSFEVLPTLLEAGADLQKRARALRAERPRVEEPRVARHRRLATADPW